MGRIRPTVSWPIFGRVEWRASAITWDKLNNESMTVDASDVPFR